MSTSAQIESVRRIEQRNPVDLICSGHTYRKGTAVVNEGARRAINHVRRLKNPTEEQIVQVLRLHRIGF